MKITLILLGLLFSVISIAISEPADFPVYYTDEDDKEILAAGKFVVDYENINQKVSAYAGEASKALKNFICSVKNYPNHKNEQCYQELVKAFSNENREKNIETLDAMLELFSDDEDESINENNKILGVINSEGIRYFVLRDEDDFIYGVKLTLVNGDYSFIMKDIKKLPNMVISSMQNSEDEDYEDDDEEIVKTKGTKNIATGYTPVQIKSKNFKGYLEGKIKYILQGDIEKLNSSQNDPVVKLFLKAKRLIGDNKFAELANLYNDTSRKRINQSLNHANSAYKVTAENMFKKQFSSLRFILNFDPIYVIATEDIKKSITPKTNSETKQKYKSWKYLTFLMRNINGDYQFISFAYYNDFSEFLENNIEHLYK